MANEIPTEKRMGPEWIIRNRRKRHNCENHLPSQVPVNVEVGDKWVCPECRRRWRLIYVGTPDGCSSEFDGLTIDGPDNSVYWRPFRARILGGFT